MTQTPERIAFLAELDRQTPGMRATLKMLIPAINTMRKAQALEFLDQVDKCINHTPWMYFLTGDGLCVTDRASILDFAGRLRAAENGYAEQISAMSDPV